jgi:phage terminase large subunit
MHITKSSTNVIRELRTYVWATDKTGKSLDEPVKENDHAMDALKYVASIKLSRKGSGSYSVL